MDCVCNKQQCSEPIMYVGNGITTEFPLPDGCNGDMVMIKTPECGISIRIVRDCAYQVVDGIVKFLTPPPKGSIISFSPDGYIMNARGEWKSEEIYRLGDVVTYDKVGYFAKEASCGIVPSTENDKWAVLAGVSATVDVGTVTTSECGSNAEVRNSGTPRAAILDFVLPRGEKGEKGDKGDKGNTGEQGIQNRSASCTR